MINYKTDNNFFFFKLGMYKNVKEKEPLLLGLDNLPVLDFFIGIAYYNCAHHRHILQWYNRGTQTRFNGLISTITDHKSPRTFNISVWKIEDC